MAKFLPKNKNWFEHLAEGVNDLFCGTRSARMSAEATRINNDNLIEYYEKRDSIQQQIQVAQMQLQTVMQERNFEFQLLLQEKQKDLQLQLKEIDVTIARELKAIELQNDLTVIREQRRLNNWPLTWDDQQAKEIIKSDNLLVLFVPPILKHERTTVDANSPLNNFPNIEQGLNRRLRAFLGKYKQSGRKVDFL